MPKTKMDLSSVSEFQCDPSKPYTYVSYVPKLDIGKDDFDVCFWDQKTGIHHHNSYVTHICVKVGTYKPKDYIRSDPLNPTNYWACIFDEDDLKGYEVIKLNCPQGSVYDAELHTCVDLKKN